jgi:hypothetical protein
MRKPALMLAALALVTAPLALAAVPRTETESYAGQMAFLTSDVLLQDCDADTNLGGPCFSLDGSESSVDITVADLAGLDLAFVQFYDAGWGTLGPGYVCLPAPTLGVPFGAAYLVVHVSNFPLSSLLLGCGPLNEATAGSVTVSFT